MAMGMALPKVTAHLKGMKATARMEKANVATAMDMATAKESAVVVAARSACSRWFR